MKVRKRNEFGKFLSHMRVSREESLQEMADKLYMSISYLSYMEIGSRSITLDLLVRIKDTYKLDKKSADELYLSAFRSMSTIKFPAAALTEDVIIKLMKLYEAYLMSDKKNVMR